MELLPAVEKILLLVWLRFPIVKTAVKNSINLLVAAQNCHFEAGLSLVASIPMLQDINVKYCSWTFERTYFAETSNL